jgi:hypothetical protein
MFCAFHSANTAVVQCSGCTRPLCPACDHRIRGYAYCQSCIVAGVQTLQQRAQQPTPNSRRTSSPAIASLLSLICPGLGAAYNGQTSKAIVHFAIFASFFQMAVVTDGVLFFIFGFIGTWLFAAVDAFRTAQLIRAGLRLESSEDVIAQRLYSNPLAWSVTLLVLGIVFLLHTLFNVQMPIGKILPFLLVGLGAYMLFDFIRRRSRGMGVPAKFDARQPPPSVVGATFEPVRFSTGELVTHVPAREGSAAPYDSRL